MGMASSTALGGYGIGWLQCRGGTVSSGYGVGWVQHRVGIASGGCGVRWVYCKKHHFHSKYFSDTHTNSTFISIDGW